MRSGPSSNILDSSRTPAFVFAFFALGGAALIAVSKTSGMGPISAILTPIVLMFVYLGLSWTRRLRLHNEQTGDNIYYMGFLFTLTSLAVSLYQFGTGSSTDEVVRNFGIAISSTITGIALRIFYNQTRRDPADIERTARHELADMTRRVRTEMENVAREFADFRRTSNLMLQEGFDEIAKQAERNGEKVRETMDHLATSAIKPVEAASARLLEAIDASTKSLSERTERLSGTVRDTANSVTASGKDISGSLGNLSQTLETFSGKIDSVSFPEQVLQEVLPPLIRQFSAVLSSHLQASEAVAQRQSGQITQIVEILGSVAASAERSATATQRCDARTGELVRALTDQSDRIGRLVDVFHKQQKRPFRSPSAIARTITGTRRNGWAFFGSRRSGRKRQVETQSEMQPADVPDQAGDKAMIDLPGPEGGAPSGRMNP